MLFYSLFPSLGKGENPRDGTGQGCLEGKVDWRDELTEKKGREEKTDNEKKEVC